LTDDYTFTVPEGHDISKKQFMLDMKTFWHPTAIIRTEQKVKAHKNTAVITGLSTYKWRDNNKDFLHKKDTVTLTFLKKISGF
jgi:hypothetical protein